MELKTWQQLRLVSTALGKYGVSEDYCDQSGIKL
jgi:hypothetical protein